MRDIDDILADVIEKLEPEATLPKPTRKERRSPCGLWTSPGKPLRWYADLSVDGLHLIDAARGRGCSVAVYSEAGAPVAEAGVEIPSSPLAVGGQKRPSSREALIVALAEALGVETEESE